MRQDGKTPRGGGEWNGTEVDDGEQEGKTRVG